MEKKRGGKRREEKRREERERENSREEERRYERRTFKHYTLITAKNKTDSFLLPFYVFIINNVISNNKVTQYSQ